MRIHIVKKGEDIYDIAGEYGISPIKLCENNGIPYGGRLIEGEELLILIPTRSTVAKRKDSLSDIARRFSVKEEDLLAINPELIGCANLYDGQPIVVKYGEPLYGLGIGNGYFYRGCTKEKLMAAMPYMNYVTISSAVARGDRLSLLFDDREVTDMAHSAGKITHLRIWLGDMGEGALEQTVKSAALLAKMRGHSGLTLAGLGCEMETRERVLEAKKIALECDLTLFIEGDVTTDLDHTEYADGTILTYDKIQMENIPSFEDGERVQFERFATVHDSLRAFIELSPFALIGDKYVTKSEARESILRGKGDINEGADGDYMIGKVGHGRREKQYIWESMRNTKKKLEMLSELGYYGISFDIARVPIYELLMFRVMFSSGIGIG